MFRKRENSAREALSRTPATLPGSEQVPEAGKISPESHSSDLRRRSRDGGGSLRRQILPSPDARATIAVVLDAREKKNEAVIRFLLTDRDDFDK